MRHQHGFGCSRWRNFSLIRNLQSSCGKFQFCSPFRHEGCVILSAGMWKAVNGNMFVIVWEDKRLSLPLFFFCFAFWFLLNILKHRGWTCNSGFILCVNSYFQDMISSSPSLSLIVCLLFFHWYSASLSVSVGCSDLLPCLPRAL